MKSYIVRIYRGEQGGGELLGSVERPGQDIKLAFTSRDELWKILIRDIGKTARSDQKESRHQ